MNDWIIGKNLDRENLAHDGRVKGMLSERTVEGLEGNLYLDTTHR